MASKNIKRVSAKAPFKDLRRSTGEETNAVLKSLPVFSELKNILVLTKKANGVLHQDSCWNVRSSWLSDIRSITQEESTLEEVLASSCKECNCFYRVNHLAEVDPLAAKQHAALRATAVYLFDLPMVFNSRNITARTNSATVQKKLDKIVYLQDTLKKDCQVDATVFPILHALMDDMANEVEITIKTLQEFFNLDSFKEKALSVVKELLIPHSLQGADSLLDETESLIGVYPNPLEVYTSTKVKGVVTSFKIKSTNESLVLKAPRYLETYLFHTLTALNGASFLVTAVTLPKDPAVVEIAANLWDPKSKSELASLKNALMSAEKIVS